MSLKMSSVKSSKYSSQYIWFIRWEKIDDHYLSNDLHITFDASENYRMLKKLAQNHEDVPATAKPQLKTHKESVMRD